MSPSQSGLPAPNKKLLLKRLKANNEENLGKQEFSQIAGGKANEYNDFLNVDFKKKHN